MADRILRVNAYTTFTLLDAEREGHGWAESAPAVLNVTSGADDAVALEVELDNSAADAVDAHAERISLSADEARELAAELETYADRAEAEDEA